MATVFADCMKCKFAQHTIIIFINKSKEYNMIIVLVVGSGKFIKHLPLKKAVAIKMTSFKLDLFILAFMTLTLFFQGHSDTWKVKLNVALFFSWSSELIEFILCMVVTSWTSLHTKCFLWLWHSFKGEIETCSWPWHYCNVGVISVTITRSLWNFNDVDLHWVLVSLIMPVLMPLTYFQGQWCHKG